VTRLMQTFVLAGAASTASAPPALAHGDSAGAGSAWSSAIAVLALAGAATLLYLAAASARVSWLGRWRVAGSVTGLAVLAVALLPPLDTAAAALFSAHMVQHLLLVVVAAPLLALGRPMPTTLAALSPRARRAVSRLRRSTAWQRLSSVSDSPLTAWSLHVGALWAWHVPALYDAALRMPWLHALEHACLFGTALMFWGIVAGPRGRHRLGVGGGLLYLFSAAMQCGMLGALIALAETPWYDAHAGTTAAWGLSSLEDQELAGLIMWIPASATYLVAILAMVTGWLAGAGADRRVKRQDV
jgi:putative membrane protein